MAHTLFGNAADFYKLLAKLVARPRRGEVSDDKKEVPGLPVIQIEAPVPDGFFDGIDQALTKAGTNDSRVLCRRVDISRHWHEVCMQRPSLVSPEPSWARAEVCRRALQELRDDFELSSKGRARVVFRRFGLVNWLVDATTEEKRELNEQELFERLRGWVMQRSWWSRFLRQNHGAMDAISGLAEAKWPWWAWLVAFYVIPAFWFPAWRIMGVEYRWLLRQPYMVPHGPVTLIGFALRLVQPRRQAKKPDRLAELLISAFLADLRDAYRRRPWHWSGYCHTSYVVAILEGIDSSNGGDGFIESLSGVRNETGNFDPLLVIAGRAPEVLQLPSSASTDNDAPEHSVSRERPTRAFQSWVHRVRSAERRRVAPDWRLALRLPPPPKPDTPEWEEAHGEVVRAQDLELRPPAPWARRSVAGLTALALALACVAGGGVAACAERQAAKSWAAQHCGLPKSDPDAHNVETEEEAPGPATCIGVSSHGFTFGESDPSLKKTMATIAAQNDEADRDHQVDGRRLVTLVHVSALFGGDGQQYAREQLQGVASAQRRQLDKGDQSPAVRILVASAGAGMKHGPAVASRVQTMMRRDRSILGVVGLDQSRQATIETVRKFTEVGLPMVATTLSADELTERSTMYYQVGPQNRREADVAAAYARNLLSRRSLKEAAVRLSIRTILPTFTVGT